MAKCPTCRAPVNLAPDGDPKYEPPRLANAVRSAIENAYGLLWMVHGDDVKVHEARKELLGMIGKEGQKRGISSAMSKHENPPIESMLHLLP